MFYCCKIITVSHTSAMTKAMPVRLNEIHKVLQKMLLYFNGLFK